MDKTEKELFVSLRKREEFEEMVNSIFESEEVKHINTLKCVKKHFSALRGAIKIEALEMENNNSNDEENEEEDKFEENILEEYKYEYDHE